MTSQRKINKVKELGDFLEALEKYRGYLYLLQEKGLTKKQKTDTLELRNVLLGGVGQFKVLITELTGKDQVTITTKLRGHLVDEHAVDMWLTGLRMPLKPVTIGVLSDCIDVTRIAIGKLQDGIRMGIRDKQGNLIEKAQKFSSEPPKAFIAHGGKSGVLDKLQDFIRALGIDPLIVELLPSKGMSVDDKVNKYIKDADCGIVLATKGGIIDKKSQKQHPRLNVIDEFERLRAVFPDKTILLLEKGVDLPSNIAGLTCEPFARQSMDRAFTAIARELTAFGILRAVKALTEE